MNKMCLRRYNIDGRYTGSNSIPIVITFYNSYMLCVDKDVIDI